MIVEAKPKLSPSLQHFRCAVGEDVAIVASRVFGEKRTVVRTPAGARRPSRFAEHDACRGLALKRINEDVMEDLRVFRDHLDPLDVAVLGKPRWHIDLGI